MSSTSLPPSSEEAYRKKCIELRRRMLEVEENNDATRLRRARLLRGIRKMRIERAILLDSLSKRMRKNGSAGTAFDEDSEDSTESPPTPEERPMRIKKPHRRVTDMSSPIIPTTLPATSTQPQQSSMSAPFSGPGAQNDPFATVSQFTSAELRPPPSISDISYDPTAPQSAFELFSEHLTRVVLPRYSAKVDSGSSVNFLAQDAWEAMSDDIRKAWEDAEQAIKSNLEKSKAAEEWKKTVGNRSRSIGVKAIEVDADEDDDDDVVMVATENTARI